MAAAREVVERTASSIQRSLDTEGIRDLLLRFYDQQAVTGAPDDTFRAPRGEIQKVLAWKDPDTLWEHYGGGPQTSCHGASSDMDFIYSR